jgi:hypothetical protein
MTGIWREVAAIRFHFVAVVVSVRIKGLVELPAGAHFGRRTP